MSALKEYIEKAKKETEDFSEIEILRYVYLDLGKRFNFNLDFSFGNSKNKKKIYQKVPSEKNLNENMETNIIICKSISYIYEFILKELGTNIRTVSESLDIRDCPHVYNVVTTQTQEKFVFDLQKDMKNIKANSRTNYFGIPLVKGKQPIISRYDLEKIDRKLGYITKDLYYTDEFLDLIKLDMAMFEDFGEKAQFILENLDSYSTAPIGYADRRWRMQKIIGNENKNGQLFSIAEKKKIHIIDCYRENDEGIRTYQLCIAVEVKGGTDLYMFSDKENRFCKISMEEFAELTKKGLKHLQEIPKLKHFLRNQSKELEEK